MSATRPREGSALLLLAGHLARAQSRRFPGLEKARRDQSFGGTSPRELQADPVQMVLLALSYSWGYALLCFWKVRALRGKRSCRQRGPTWLEPCGVSESECPVLSIPEKSLTWEAY